MGKEVQLGILGLIDYTGVMKVSFAKKVALIMGFLLISIYYLPFIIGDEAIIVDRYIRNDDQTPFYIIYSPRFTPTWKSAFDLQKAAVTIHRRYNQTNFSLALSPTIPFRHLLIAQIHPNCSGGVCFSYNYLIPDERFNHQEQKLITEYLKTNTDSFSAAQYLSFLRKNENVENGKEVLLRAQQSMLQWDSLKGDYRHDALETIFLTKPISADK